MFKSNPIPMIQGANQITAIKLVACYQYKNSGTHYTGTISSYRTAGVDPVVVYDSLKVRIYGIDKRGDTNLIATCPLNTTSDYSANEYASSTIVGIQTHDYNFICYTYDVFEAIDFDKMLSLSIIADTREIADVLNSNTYTKVYEIDEGGLA